MTTVLKKYHLVRDRHDERDHYVHTSACFKLVEPVNLPASVDLRNNCSPVEDQGDLGSCTGNAIVGAMEYLENAEHEFEEGRVFARLSRLFVYYNERMKEGDINQDNGAQICDGVASLQQYGIPTESTWPYMVHRFAVAPSQDAYTEALQRRTTEYARVSRTNGIMDIKRVLASGYPIIFGFTVFDGFESDAVAASGTVELPGLGETNQGGHAVLGVGYDDATQRVLVRNSWGPNWGIKGYFTLPYAYVTSNELSSDFWTVTK
jgi:C1A family cysteine protease